MMRIGTVLVIVALGAMAAGCGPKEHPTRTGGSEADRPSVDSPVPTDPRQRLEELGRRATELQQVASRMPGQNAAQDRQLAAEAFEKSAASLELLAGPSPGGAFRQQLRIIDNTRNFLRRGGEDVAPEPAVDAGLRSVYRALVGVSQRLFPDDARVQAQLDALSNRLGELDAVRGPLHALVVSQAFEATSKVVDAMARELSGRSSETAAAYPATRPTR